MMITRTQAATHTELQAMIAWDNVPSTSSSDDASAGLVTDRVAAIAVDEVRMVEAKVVDISDGGWLATSSSSHSLGGRREGELRGRAATAARGYDRGCEGSRTTRRGTFAGAGALASRRCRCSTGVL